MHDIEWKTTAIVDLIAIIGYIADDNPVAATVLLDEVQIKVDHFADNPKFCRMSRLTGTREFIIRLNYLVI